MIFVFYLILWEPNFAGLLAYHNVTGVKFPLNFDAKFIISLMKLTCYYGNVFFSEKAHVF